MIVKKKRIGYNTEVTILVDETLKPIIDDQVWCFEIDMMLLDAKSENELIKSFLTRHYGSYIIVGDIKSR
jgi:hypothetical protein